MIIFHIFLLQALGPSSGKISSQKVTELIERIRQRLASKSSTTSVTTTEAATTHKSGDCESFWQWKWFLISILNKITSWPNKLLNLLFNQKFPSGHFNRWRSSQPNQMSLSISHFTTHNRLWCHWHMTIVDKAHFDWPYLISIWIWIIRLEHWSTLSQRLYFQSHPQTEPAGKRKP